MQADHSTALLLLSLLLAVGGWTTAAAYTVRMQQQKQQQQKQQQQRSSSDELRVGSVRLLAGGQLQLLPNVLAPDAVAQAELQCSLNRTGWDVLDVRAGGAGGNDTATMYAAGLLEGFLTADRIRLQYANLMDAFFGPSRPSRKLLPRVRDFLRRQRAWASALGGARPRSAVERHARLVMAQLDGLVDGYFRSNASRGLRDDFVLLMLNAVGDILDLTMALNDTKPDFSAASPEEFAAFVRSSGHCTALVRATPGLERLLMGHSSWFLYAATLRVYKHYSLRLRDPDSAAVRTSFSSYPGFLESLDDFYIMDSGLVLLQTTNNVFNTSLYKFVSPNSLLAWQRVRVANQVARSGAQWAQAVQQYNSGTYNNQYMVVDLKRFRRGRGIDDGALTVVEQIPTLVEWSDQTRVLRTGYWPSYNVPFHEKVYNLSGYPDVVRQRGLDFSYQLAPRAKIFRRDANSVFSNSDMAAFLRFNEFQLDPYSDGNPFNSICSRGDLAPGGLAKPDGCYDSKFTDDVWATSLGSFAVSGPTLGDAKQPLPAFAWSQFPNVSHRGLPPAYSFGWVFMQPR